MRQKFPVSLRGVWIVVTLLHILNVQYSLWFHSQSVWALETFHYRNYIFEKMRVWPCKIIGLFISVVLVYLDRKSRFFFGRWWAVVLVKWVTTVSHWWSPPIFFRRTSCAGRRRWLHNDDWIRYEEWRWNHHFPRIPV